MNSHKAFKEASPEFRAAMIKEAFKSLSADVSLLAVNVSKLNAWLSMTKGQPMPENLGSMIKLFHDNADMLTEQIAVNSEIVYPFKNHTSV